MSKYRSQQRQELIEWLGDPLVSMWKTYQHEGIKYLHVPAEYSMVIKKRTNSLDTIIPPLLPYLNEFASLNDLFDSQNAADKTNFFKILFDFSADDIVSGVMVLQSKSFCDHCFDCIHILFPCSGPRFVSRSENRACPRPVSPLGDRTRIKDIRKPLFVFHARF